MSNPRGEHAGGDGSFARDAGTQTTKAVLLVAVAVVVGIVMLSRTPTTTTNTTTPAGSSHGANGGAVAKSTTTTVPATTTTTTSLPAPSTVKVVIFNGTPTPHGAGYFSTKLHGLGYDTLAPENATVTNQAKSVIYVLVAGYEGSGAAIAKALGLPATAVQTTMPTTVPIPTAVIKATSPDIAILLGNDIADQSLTPSTSTGSSG